MKRVVALLFVLFLSAALDAQSKYERLPSRNESLLDAPDRLRPRAAQPLRLQTGRRARPQRMRWTVSPRGIRVERAQAAFKSADEEMNRRLENAANAAAPALQGRTANTSTTVNSGSGTTDASDRAVKGETTIPPEANDPRVQKLVDVIENTDVSAGDIGPSAARNAALALYLNEKYDEALPYFERAGAPELFDEALSLKYAIALGESGQRTRAVNFLLKMVKRGKGTPDAYKLLGYFYLWIPEKLDASIDYTSRYLAKVPKNDGAQFNLACAYAQLYGRNGDDQDRKRALVALKEAIDANPVVWKKRARDFMIADFWALKEDPEFQALIR